MKKTEVPDNEKQSQVGVGYENPSTRPGATCAGCVHFIAPDRCEHVQGPIAAAAWCLKFEKRTEEKSVTTTIKKFIPFAKVDNSIDPGTGKPRREVWGIVTAEVPDKEDEVCDYAGSKPYYQAVIDEMGKATAGKNYFPLREMHGLSAAGKCIGFEFRDADREIFMGFKVVDDEAWKKVDEGVYTGFSQGGSLVGALKPDPVFDGCMRYTANPSEVSLVDNPCLAAAHFAYVKADGVVELRKFKHTEAPATHTRIERLEQEVLALRKATGTLPLTKLAAGEQLPAESFAIVGDAKKPATWKLPVKFATKQKSAIYVTRAILLAKYSDDQARDDHGEWTSGGGSSGSDKKPRMQGGKPSIAGGDGKFAGDGGNGHKIYYDDRNVESKNNHATIYNNNSRAEGDNGKPQTADGKTPHEVIVEHDRKTGHVTVSPVRMTDSGGVGGKVSEFDNTKDAADHLKSKYGITHTFVPKTKVFTPTVYKRITDAADWAGVDQLAVLEGHSKVSDHFRRAIRIRVNKLAKTKDPGHALSFIDADLGKFSKGMYEVGQLACLIQQLSYLVYAAVYEREQEQDGSLLPQDLTENVDALLDTLVSMLAEESDELREDLEGRAHAS